MPETNNGDAHEPLTGGGLLATLKTGLSVLWAELKWTLTKSIREYETRQMRRRLEREYATLGRIARKRMDAAEADAPSRDGEAGLVLSQIEFLERELDFLDKEGSRTRSEDLERRRRDLGLDQDQ
ncbi:hypothetical protein [Desulfocurvus sp. DL9XJH121]